MWTQPMWWGTTMTRKWWFLLVSTWSAKSLPFWIPSRIPHSQYLQWLQVMVVFISNLNILSISPMFRICDRYLDWEIKRSYYLLHSMDRTWLISLEIAKWSKCIHRWCDPPIWWLRTRTTICSPRWSLTISQPTTVDRWKIAANRW